MTATGPISTLISRMKTRVSESAAFQTFVSAGDASTALGSIHTFKADGDEKPCCLMSVFTNGCTKVAEGCYRTERVVVLEFLRDVNTAVDHEVDSENFTNSIGVIETDIKTSLADLDDGGLDDIEFEGPEIIYVPEGEEYAEGWVGIIAIHCLST